MSKTSSSLALSQGAIDRDKATDGAASPRPPAPIGALPAIQPEILQLLLEGPPAYVADTNGREIGRAHV